MVTLVPAVCPQCGAKLKLPEGTKQTNCQFCGVEILLDKGEIIHLHREDVSDKVARLYSLADKHMGLGNFAEAYGYSKQLIELDPDNPIAWFFAGVSGYVLGKDDELAKGVREARMLIAKNPGDEKCKAAKERLDRYFAALVNEAPGWRKGKRPVEASRVGYAMLVVRPDDPLGWYYYGWATRQLGRERDAKNAFSQVGRLCDKSQGDERCKSIAKMMSEDSRSEMVVKAASFVDTIVKPFLVVLVFSALAIFLRDVPIGGIVFGLAAVITCFTVATQVWELDTVAGYSLAVLSISAMAFMVKSMPIAADVAEVQLGALIISVGMTVVAIYHLLRLGQALGLAIAVLFSIALAILLKDVPYGMAFAAFAVLVLVAAFFQSARLLWNFIRKPA